MICLNIYCGPVADDDCSLELLADRRWLSDLARGGLAPTLAPVLWRGEAADCWGVAEISEQAITNK